MGRVLVVEDEELIVEFLKRTLELENHSVEIATDGEQGFKKAMTNYYDVIVLDVMLPSMNGLEVCRELRQARVNTPILFLSAQGSEQARIDGLDAGADDYLVKPFSYKELNARLRAITRRPSVDLQATVTVGGLSLYSAKHELRVDGQLVNLRPKELELLKRLMRSPGIVVSKQELLKSVWNIPVDSSSNRLEVCVKNLRSKIDRPGQPSRIQTIRYRGYKLIES